MSQIGAERGRRKEQMASQARLSKVIVAHTACRDAGQCVGTTGVQASSGTFINEVCGEKLRKGAVSTTGGQGWEHR